jgi:hypothetical protein
MNRAGRDGCAPTYCAVNNCFIDKKERGAA